MAAHAWPATPSPWRPTTARCRLLWLAATWTRRSATAGWTGRWISTPGPAVRRSPRLGRRTIDAVLDYAWPRAIRRRPGRRPRSWAGSARPRNAPPGAGAGAAGAGRAQPGPAAAPGRPGGDRPAAARRTLPGSSYVARVAGLPGGHHGQSPGPAGRPRPRQLAGMAGPAGRPAHSRPTRGQRPRGRPHGPRLARTTSWS